MTEDERRELEERALNEQRLRESMAEKEPVWQLFVDLEGRKEYESGEYWRTKLEEEAEMYAGDEADRWASLSETFSLNTDGGKFEEYDGLNHDGAKNLVLLVHLPMLMRGHAIQTQIKDEFLKLRVPNLYKLELGLPVDAEEEDATSFFDCKIRRLICTIPVKQPKICEVFDEAPEAEVEVFESAREVEPLTIDEIVEKATEPEPSNEEDDLLFDLV